MLLYAALGPRDGPCLNRDAWRFATIFGAPLDAADSATAIGQARHIGFDRHGVAAWELTIDGAEIPGRWAIVGRRFVPAPG